MYFYRCVWTVGIIATQRFTIRTGADTGFILIIVMDIIVRSICIIYEIHLENVSVTLWRLETG